MHRRGAEAADLEAVFVIVDKVGEIGDKETKATRVDDLLETNLSYSVPLR
jgi:hypothetical protein